MEGPDKDKLGLFSLFVVYTSLKGYYVNDPGQELSLRILFFSMISSPISMFG